MQYTRKFIKSLFMGRKTNSISLRLKKTNKDYIHCMYGDILYAHIFKNSLKMQKTYIDIFKTIDIPCPQLSLTGGYKKANVYVLYLDPRSRAVLSEKFNIQTRFYRRINKNLPKSTENRLSKSLNFNRFLLREKSLFSVSGGVDVEESTQTSIIKNLHKKKEGWSFVPSPYKPPLCFIDKKKEKPYIEEGYIHKGALGLCFKKHKPKSMENYKRTKRYDNVLEPCSKKNFAHGFLENILQNRFLETSFFAKQKNPSIYKPIQNSYMARFLQEKDICLAFLKIYVYNFFFEQPKSGFFLGVLSLIKNKHIFFGQPYKEILSLKNKTSPLYKYTLFKDLYVESLKKNLDPGVSKKGKIYIRNLSKSLKTAWGNRLSMCFIKSTNEKACALFLAHYVSYFLERKVLFRHVKQQLSKSLSSRNFLKKRKKKGIEILALWGAQKFTLPVGIRICCSGRVGSRSKKAQRSRKDTFMWGETGLHVFSNMLDFAKTHAETSFGTVGIKVWVCYKKV